MDAVDQWSYTDWFTHPIHSIIPTPRHTHDPIATSDRSSTYASYVSAIATNLLLQIPGWSCLSKISPKKYSILFYATATPLPWLRWNTQPAGSEMSQMSLYFGGFIAKLISRIGTINITSNRNLPARLHR